MGVFPVRFDRFSPYYFREQEYGLRLTPYDYYEFCYPFSPVVLRNMAYYFQDLNYDARYMRDLLLRTKFAGSLLPPMSTTAC